MIDDKKLALRHDFKEIFNNYLILYEMDKSQYGLSQREVKLD